MSVRHPSGNNEQADGYMEFGRQVWAKGGQNWTLQLGKGVCVKRRIDLIFIIHVFHGVFFLFNMGFFSYRQR